jgi:hypothetical protein
MKPICYDLFCGLGGWSTAFLAEGYECVGFDIEAHDYGTGGYPGTLIIRDVRSIHGSELKDAAVIVASPPCQAYSYRAMPWKRAKALPPPDNTLFNECFRIQREASEAAGHYIPLIVENVRGAQKWVGRARWNYGSFYLWGDVPALMPMTIARKVSGFRFDGESHGSFQTAAVNEAIKNGGGSWFAVAHNTASGKGQNPDGRKGIPHRTAGHWTNPAEHEGVKQGGSGAAWFDKLLDERRKEATAIKNGGDWFSSGENCSLQRRQSSRGTSRKAASAHIAKIPFPLAQHIARCFLPVEVPA